MTAIPPDWSAVLDEMERRLTVVGRMVVGEGDVHVDHFTLPPGLGPLPPELAARARALLQATGEAEAQVEARMVDLADRLSRTVSPSHPVGRGGAESDRPVPRYFDRTA